MKKDGPCAKITAEEASELPLPRFDASLLMLLVCSGLLLVLWSFAVPVFETPDEQEHWQYAHYLHKQKKLPFYDSHFVEANQPPLYYLLVAPFASSSLTLPLAPPYFLPRHFLNGRVDFNRYWPIRITRLATCILSLLTVYFAYLSGVEAAGNRSTGILAGALTAFLPQFTLRGMSISNDAMVATASAIAVYLIIRLVKRGFTPKRGIVTSTVIAAAFLSKINAIALLVPFTLAILTEKGRWLERLVCRFWVFGVGIILAAPWLARNYELYGDLLATRQMWTAVPMQMVPKPIGSSYFCTVFPSTLWRSFVGMPSGSSWKKLAMPELFYQFFVVLTLLGATGFVWRLIRHPDDRRLGAILISIPVVTLLLLIQLNLIVSQPQGRYMFPALTTIALLVAMGVEALPRWNRHCTLALIILTGVINVGVLGATIIPAYWFPADYASRIDVSVLEAHRNTATSGDCSIDLINEKPVPTHPIDVSGRLFVQGWATLSAQQGIAPDAVFTTLSRDDGNIIRAVRARVVPRPDVNTYFKHPEMGPVGFEALLDTSALKGRYKLQIYVKRQKQFFSCQPTVEISL